MKLTILAFMLPLTAQVRSICDTCLDCCPAPPTSIVNTPETALWIPMSFVFGVLGGYVYLKNRNVGRKEKERR